MSQAQTNLGSEALIRRMVIYFLGNIGTKFVTLILTRLQSQIILPELYGQISLLTTIVPQLVSIIFLEMWSGLLRFMYDRDDEVHKKQVFATVLALSLVLLPAFGIIIWFVSLYTKQTALYPYLIVMGVVTLLDYLYQFSARGLNRNKLYALVGILTSLVTGLSQIVMLAGGMGGKAMIVSPIIGGTFAFVVYEYQLGMLRGLKRSDVSLVEMKAMARFCWPLAVNATAYFALTKFNELYVSRQAGDVALSNLTVANKTGMFLTIFITIFSLAWQEQAFSVSREKERVQYYETVLHQYLSLLGLGLFMLIPAGRLIFKILIDTTKYGETSIALIPFALLAAAASALSNFMGHIFSAEKRNDALFYTTVIGAVANVLFMVVLYPLIGLQAANLSLLLGFLVTFVARFIYLRTLLPIRIERGLLLGRTALLLAVTILYYVFPTLGSQMIILAVAVVVSLYLMRDLVTGVLTRLWSSIRHQK